MKRKAKKLRFKRRRHLDIDRLFNRKVDEKLLQMDWSIRQAFPDPVERQKYIQSLIKGLGNESTSEQIE